MKKLLTFILFVFLSFGMSAQTVKYVFLFIGDGMGPNTVYYTDMVNKAINPEAKDLNFYYFPVFSLMSTHSANSLVTDSSAAGTAIATGVKINNGALGYTPDGQTPVTLAELAKRNGFGAGVVTSVGVNHATPASFYGHVESRSQYNELAQQLNESQIDFAAGSTFLTKGDSTPQMLVEKAKAAGLNVFCGREEYKAVKGGRVIYLSNKLNQSSLSFAIDRKPGETELADFTSAAIEHLYSNYPKGFFLMVEGGRIDYGTHATDAATSVAEVNDMAKSIDLALAFLAQHPKETLIMVTADHDTGGLALSRNSYEMNPKYLENQKISKDMLSVKLAQLRAETNNNVSWTQVKDVLRAELGLWDKVPVSKSQQDRLTEAYKRSFLDDDKTREVNLYSSNERLAAVAIDCLAESAGISWPFSSHSGAPVIFSAIGAHAEDFKTVKDNTDIVPIVKAIAKYK